MTNQHINYHSIKDALNIAFRALRKLNIVALQRTPCCQSCSLAELCDVMKEKKNKKKLGAVYYHQQDLCQLREQGSLHIRFTCREKQKNMMQVGALAAVALASAGLRVVWDGTEHQAIRVDGLLSEQV